jgi:hypothetical protein
MNIRPLLLLLPITTPLAAEAHHSTAEFAPASQSEEHEGVIESIVWRNPHIRMTIRVEDDASGEVVWDTESQDLNTLGRIGVTREMVQVGQRVRFAGRPSRRRDHYMLLSNLLIEDQTEIVMRMNGAPRWNAEAVVGGGDITQDPLISDDIKADGIFRVWSYAGRSGPQGYIDDIPLTGSARAALETFDPIRDDPVLRCEQPGMPEAMTYIGPHPIEFIDNGDRITLRVESDDVVRVIHMTDDESGNTPAPSPLGYSVGRFEDEDTLVVTTTSISWPFIKMAGIVAAPQSAESEIVERFEMSSDESELRYSLTISDPGTFTRPLNAENYAVWQWLPGAVVEPYECTLSE